MSPEEAIATIETIEAEPGFRTNGGQSGDSAALIRALPGQAFLPPISMTIERVGDSEVAVTLANRDQGCSRSLRFLARGYSGFDVAGSDIPEAIPDDAWTWERPRSVMIGIDSTPQAIAQLTHWLLEG